MTESLLALNVRPPASSRDKNFADAVLEPLALALRCPRGRLQLAHAAAATAFGSVRAPGVAFPALEKLARQDPSGEVLAEDKMWNE